MDTIATAIMLIAIGTACGAAAWLGRHAGFKSVALFLIVAALGIGGGVWVLWP